MRAEKSWPVFPKAISMQFWNKSVMRNAVKSFGKIHWYCSNQMFVVKCTFPLFCKRSYRLLNKFFIYIWERWQNWDESVIFNLFSFVFFVTCSNISNFGLFRKRWRWSTLILNVTYVILNNVGCKFY